TVNALCPGFTATDIVWSGARNIVTKTGKSFDDAVKALAEMNPGRRLLEPDEVADAPARLVPDDTPHGETVGRDGTAPTAPRVRRPDDRFRQAHELPARRPRLQETPPRDRRRLPRVLRQALPRHDAGRCARSVRCRRRRADRDRGVRGAAVSAVAERFKIRHRLPPARWPTREEAARARLFQPPRIGPIAAAQRTSRPAARRCPP